MKSLLFNMIRALRRDRRRRGSVLILCVVIIVILALIGTAMLSRARIDRGTTVQNTNNTEIDLLLEGTKNVAKAVVIGDVFDGALYRPPFNAPFPYPNPAETGNISASARYTSYDNWDAPALLDPLPTAMFPQDATVNGARNDVWLMPRLPNIPDWTVSAALGTNVPFWASITAPLVGGTFDSPLPVLTGAAHTGIGTKPVGTPSTVYTQHTSFSTTGTVTPLEPDYITEIRGYGNPIQVSPPLPAWTINGLKYIAADADGDGVADAGLVRLPVGQINGLTFFAGIRIIDNNSAINVNTAMRRDFDYDGSANGALIPATGFFTSNVGLLELLATRTPNMGTSAEEFVDLGQEMNDLNLFRFHQTGANPQVPPGVMTGPPAGPPSPPLNGGPFDDTGAVYNPLVFTSIGDALSMNLSRRLDNPGHMGTTTTDLYQRFPAADSAALASRFCLSNPSASLSSIEQKLFASTTASSSPYLPNDVINWFNANFDYQAELVPNAKIKPRRPLLTTNNPVTNQMPRHNLLYKFPYGVSQPIRYNGGTTEFDATGQFTPPPTRFMRNYNAGTTALAAEEPAAKADANTAWFGELWRAYWNVMVDQTNDVTGTPFPQPAGLVPAAADIYNGNTYEQWEPADPPPLVKYAPLKPSDGTEGYHPQRMFRSSVRDMRVLAGAGTNSVGVFLPPDQMMLLRSALAAVNTEDLRDHVPVPAGQPLQEVNTTRQIQLKAIVDGTAKDVNVKLYGYEPQPFITEVYANNDNNTNFGDPGGPPLKNMHGYIAVELYNPYPFPISLQGWALVILDRRGPDPASTPPITNPYPTEPTNGFRVVNVAATAGAANPDPFPAGANTTIQPHGYLVLYNFNLADPGGAQVPPTQAGTPANAYYVKNLHWVTEDTWGGHPEPEGRGGELVLLRPDLTLPAGTALNVHNGIPVDSFDFTGFYTPERYDERAGGPVNGSTRYLSWHYVRSNEAAPNTPNWKFVYPGRYDGRRAERRQQGVDISYFDIENNLPETIYTPPVALGASDATASYPTVHTIQLSNTDAPGPFPPSTGALNRYPFGGFARNGDLLQVPYMGAYRIELPPAGPPTSRQTPPPTPAQILELNPITMDSIFADDADSEDDEPPTLTAPTQGVQYEQVGRFSPVYFTGGGTEVNDFDPQGTYDFTDTTGLKRWHYRWARHLFDYLTVQSPANDYLAQAPKTINGNWDTTIWTGTNPDGSIGPPAVSNSGTTPANRYNEEAEPVQGLININTAPWIVLKQLPWVPPDPATGSVDRLTIDPASGTVTAASNNIDDNEEIAKAIVLWRDGDFAGVAPQGPFETIFDLYKMPLFRVFAQALMNLNAGGLGPDNTFGDFSPYGAGLNDGVRYDFEEQYLALTRVSNLITTRSDTFTVYIVVQGWRSAGTPQAKLEVERRAAFIIDRSKLKPVFSDIDLSLSKVESGQ